MLILCFQGAVLGGHPGGKLTSSAIARHAALAPKHAREAERLRQRSPALHYQTDSNFPQTSPAYIAGAVQQLYLDKLGTSSRMLQ